MADVDGDWNCTAKTPLGEQRFTMTVTRAGDRFTGRLSGALGSLGVDDGAIAGDTLQWTMGITSPMAMTLDCSATVAGDRIEGMVRAGGFGSFPLEGVRG